MALLRPSIWPAISLSRQCTRPLSCTSRQYADPPSSSNATADMLNILKAGSLRMSRESNSSTRQRPSSSLEHAKGMAASLPGKAVQDVGMIEKRADYEQQLARKFRAGDVYSPHDLSGQEMSKWKKSRNAPKTDAIDALGINPINEYKNFSLMSEYMTEMGRIKPATETGLRPVNQRKMAKAIRRAIGVRLMPSVHRHPEILMAADRRRR